MAFASEPEPGSVSMKPPRCSPLASGRRYRSFWSSVPKRAIGCAHTLLVTDSVTASEGSSRAISSSARQ
jgi:hypothetical protein